MEGTFAVKTKEEFEKLKNSEEAVLVNFENQFDRLMEEGELVFFELEDGYGTIRFKKSFGFGKKKTIMYSLQYEEGVPYHMRNSDLKNAKKFFKEFHQKGTAFFCIPGLRVD